MVYLHLPKWPFTVLKWPFVDTLHNFTSPFDACNLASPTPQQSFWSMGFHGCWLMFYCFVLKPHDFCKWNLPKPRYFPVFQPVQEPQAEVSQLTLQSYLSSNSQPSRGSLQSQQSVATVQSMDSLHEARRRSTVYRNQNVETFLKVRRFSSEKPLKPSK